MHRILISCTNEDDVVWEPFGGLCSATVAALKINRRAFAAEINEVFYKAACERVKNI